MKRRVIACLTALVMAISLIPSSAIAAQSGDTAAEAAAAVTEQEAEPAEEPQKPQESVEPQENTSENAAETGGGTEKAQEDTSEPAQESEQKEAAEETGTDLPQAEDAETDSADIDEMSGENEEAEEAEPAEEITDEAEAASSAMTEAAPEEVKPIAGSLTAKGRGYTVTVTFTEKAGLPEGTKLQVKEITGSAGSNYEDRSADVMNVDSAKITEARFFDINLVDKDGNPLEPNTDVKVRIILDRAPADASDVQVIHFDDDSAAGDETVTAKVNGDTDIKFTADSFSVYGVVYTVDFTYGGFTYKMDGDGSVLLSVLAEELGLYEKDYDKAFEISNVSEVTFTDYDLIDVEKQADGDWLLQSLAPFSSEETLTITMNDGVKFIVDVTDDQVSSNLVDFLTNAVITGAAQDSEGRYEVEAGKEYNIILSFAESSSHQFDNRATLTYTMPDGLTILSRQTGGLKVNIVYKGRTYQVDATYDLGTDGNLQIKFDENDPDFHHLENSTNVSFRFSYYGAFDGSEEQIHFSQDIERDIVFEEPEPGQAYVTKNGTFDEQTGKFTYTITVEATGDITNVNVKDVISGNALIFNNDVRVSGNSSSYSDNGAPNGFDYTFASMQEGEVITITYSASVDFSKDDNKDGKISVDQTKNTATVKPDGGNPHSSEYSHEIAFKTTKKSNGTPDGTTADGDKIYKWTITYNELMLASAGGDTIKDTIAAGSTEYMKYYGDGLSIKVTDKNGNVEERTVPYSSLQSYSDSSWTYKIPESDTQPYMYEITYYTVVDMEKVEGTGNTVTVTNDANGTSGSADVTPESVISVTKSVDSFTTEEVNWSVTLGVPENGLAQAVVTDTFPSIWLNGRNIYDLLKDGSLQITGLLDGESYTVENVGQGQVKITFYQDRGKSITGLKATPGGHTITVKLTTLVDQEWLQKGYETGGYEQTHTNNVDFNGKKAEASVIFGKPGIEKKGEALKDSEGNVTGLKYTVVLKGVSETPVSVLDTFDTSILEVDTSKASSWDHMRIWGGNQWSQDAGRMPVSYTDTGDGIILTADSVPMQTDGTYYPYYRIVYYLKVKDGVDLQALAIANGGEYDVDNTVKWGDHESEFSYKVEYDYLDKQLLNEGELGGTNRTAKYQITFNPSKATLNEGSDMTMTDVLSANLSVDYSSINIVTDPAGQSVVYSLSGGEGGTTVATYTIPDSTKVTITYDANVRGNGSQTIVNKVSVNGKEETVENTKSYGSASEGEGAQASFKIVKVDGYDANIKLQGVKFKVFCENPDVDFGGGVKELILETDENGEITLDGEAYTFYFDEVYHVQEVEAPEDYGTISFDYLVTLTNDMQKVDYGHYIYYYSDSMQIKNWPLEGLVVEKQVESSDPADLEAYYNFRISVLNDDGSVNTDFNEKSGDDQFENGVAEFRLKAGEQKMFWGFEKGTRYKVEEIDAGGFATTVTYSVYDEDGNVTEVKTDTTNEHSGELTQEDETIVFKNKKTSNGSLKLKKLVTVNGDATEGTLADGTYEFTITGPGADVEVSKTVTITVTNGVAASAAVDGEAVELGDDGYVEVTDLEAGEYTITETAPTNGTSLVGDNGKKVTVVAGETGTDVSAKADFTNNRPGTPEFEKKIQDTNDSKGETSGWQDSADYDIGDAVPFKLTATLSKDVSTYKSYSIKFEDEMESTLTFNKISKVLLNGEAITGYDLEKDGDQHFTVTVKWGEGSDTPVSEDLNGATVEVYFTATLNKSANIGSEGNINAARLHYSNNPKNAYDFDKTPWDYVIAFTYKLDLNKIDQTGEPVEGAEFKLEKKLANGTTQKVTLTNSGNVFTGTGLDDGDYVLTETKVPAGHKPIDPIEFTVSASHEITWDYTSDELDFAGVDRTGVLTALTGETDSGDLEFAEGQSLEGLEGDVTNQAIGDLKVSKILSGNAAEEDREFHFNILVEGASGSYEAEGAATAVTFTDGAATVTLKGGESILIKGLPAGAGYNVEEVEAGQYDYATSSDGTSGTIEAGKVADAAPEASFTNTKNKGGLTITKTFAGNTDKLTNEEKKAIKFTVEGPEWEEEPEEFTYADMENGVRTYENIKLGDYTVTEDTGSGKTFTTTYKVGSDGTETEGTTVNVTVGTDGESVSFTNTYQETEITLDAQKAIETEDGVEAPEKSFKFILKAGDVVVPGENEVPMPEEGTEAIVQGAGKVSESETPFGTITYTKAGTYTYIITEEDDSGAGWYYNINNDITATVTVDENAETGALSATVDYSNNDTITNKYVTGGIKVIKTSQLNDQTDPEAEGQTFTVAVFSDAEGTQQVGESKDITIGSNGTGEVIFDGLTVGTTYYVFEMDGDEKAGEKLGEYTVVKGSGSAAAAEVITEPVELVNNKEVGDLKISKSLAGNAAEEDREFHFNILVEGASGSYKAEGAAESVSFTDGAATVTLKGGQSILIKGLPVGAGYNVEEVEAGQYDYATSSDGTSGTIQAGKVADAAPEASFTNTKNKGGLTITKTFAGNTDKLTEDDKNAISFTVTGPEWDEPQTFTYADMDKGVITFEGIRLGDYTVTESNGSDKLFVTTYKVAGEGTGQTGITAVATVDADGETVSYTNTYQEAEITLDASKAIDAEDGTTVPEKSFKFILKEGEVIEAGEDAVPMPEEGTEAIVQGAGKVSESETPFGKITYIKAGVYTYIITEEDESGAGWTYNVNGDITATVTVTEDPDTGALSAAVKYDKDGTITNSYETGDLQVNKEVVSDRAADKDQKFTFTIKLDDETITGTYGDMTFEEGVATIELVGGESKTATGLPSDTGYTVTEATAKGFVTESKGDSGTITAGETAIADFTNTRETGDLEISKTVVSDKAADKDQTFTFTIELSDTTISGTYGDMTFEEGVATIELKGGESKIAEGLPTEVDYIVTETEATGFFTEKNGDTGTITTKKSTADFTNTRETGGFSVSKKVESSTASDKDKEFTFTVTLDDDSINGTYGEMEFIDGVATFTLKDGESMMTEDLPTTVGFKVEESDNDGFVVTSTGTTGAIKKDASPVAEFVNTKVEGGLAVTKSVTSALEADHSQKFSFKVTLDDKTVNGKYGGMTFTNGVAEFQLADGESCVAEGLAKGIGYTVEEEEDGKFTTTSTGETGTIDEKEPSTAAFVNTRKTGDLEVSKEVVSDRAADKSQIFTFTIKLDDKTVTGTYGDITFEEGVAAIELKGGETKKASGLPTGIGYTVTEAAEEGFTTEKSGDTGTISTKTSTAGFTNTRETGDLEISKKVVSDKAADKDQTFSFTIKLSDTSISGTYGGITFAEGVATIELKGGESKTAKGLPTEITYTITEAEAAGFVAEKTGDTGTISTEKSTATFTNTRETGGLKVSKSVVSSTASDKDKEFTFTVTLDDTSITGTYGDMEFADGVATFTLKDGESKAAEGLPATVGYTVEEEDANTDNFVTTSTGTAGTIEKDASPEAAFVNTKVEGGLAVTKSVTSDLEADHSRKFSFKVTLDDKTVNGKYGGMTFTDGVAEFQLADGESCAAEGLAKDIGYKVEEEADGKFTTTFTGETGKILEKEVSTAAFTNTRKTGDLEVSKEVVSDRAADKSQTFTFTIELDDKTISGVYGDIEFTNGKATIELKGGETRTATGLPTEVSYTVTEAAVTGFLTEMSGDTGTISETEAAAAEFTNIRETGDLTVSKTVESENAIDNAKEFTFTVTLSDTTINGTYGDMTFTDGVAEFTLKADESKTAEGLPTEITYTVAEGEVSAGYTNTGKTGDTGTISTAPQTAEFVNTYEASGSVVLEAYKELQSGFGKKLREDQFSFELYQGEEQLQVKKNDDGGKITFDPIEYKVEGTYTYTIKETIETKPGYTYDMAEKRVTVTVVNNGDGTLTATPVYDGGSALFINSYETSGSAVLKAYKTLENRKLEDKQFIFELVNDETGVVMHTVYNDAAGNIVFPAISYTKPGTYSYTIREIVKSEKGYIYDTSEKKAVVTVTDLDEGILVTEVTYDGGESIPEFVNKYEGSVSVKKTDIMSGKEVAGATLQILDAYGMVVDEWVSTTKAHEVTGLKTGVTYTLHETAAPDGYLIASDTTFTLNEDGTLNKGKTTAKINGEGVLLVEDTHSGTRILKVDEKGKPLGGAKLQIEDGKGYAVARWTSYSTGPVEVKDLRPDVHYFLKETGAPNGYKKAAAIEFYVDKDGKIVIVSGGGKVVNNVLIMKDSKITAKGKKKPRRGARTGDDANMALWAVLAAAAAAGAAGTVIARKRKKGKKN